MLLFARLAILALSASWALSAEPSLVVYFETPITETVVENELKAEFTGLSTPLGSHTEWRTLAQNTGSGEPGQLIIVRLLGDCSTQAAESPVASGTPIASVQELDGRIMPFIDVHCAALTALVRPAFRDVSPFQQRSLLGRALARVLAHEVYHITSQSHAHRAQGITQARLNRIELTGARLLPEGNESGSDIGGRNAVAATDGR